MNESSESSVFTLKESVMTSEVLAMQIRLYGFKLDEIQPVSDILMWSVLRELRNCRPLDLFHLWLVGSRVEPKRDNSDIDVVLSPRSVALLPDEIIDNALLYCRSYCLYGSTPRCVVDPCFRVHGPSTDFAALKPDSLLKGVGLLSPYRIGELISGRLSGCRKVGRFSLEHRRRAGDANYYRKLPRAMFEGLQSAYLRPAIEVL
jgi:hypothetical protein